MMAYIIYPGMNGLLMTVKISFFSNDEIAHYCTISNVDVEFNFIKNALAYIAKNLNTAKSVKSVYYNYLNSIAVTRDSLSSKSVTHKLDKWLEDVFIPHLNYKISIKIESSHDTFQINI